MEEKLWRYSLLLRWAILLAGDFLCKAKRVRARRDRTKGSGAGEFDIVHRMAAESKGSLYIAEIANNRRAQKFVLQEK